MWSRRKAWTLPGSCVSGTRRYEKDYGTAWLVNGEKREVRCGKAHRADPSKRKVLVSMEQHWCVAGQNKHDKALYYAGQLPAEQGWLCDSLPGDLHLDQKEGNQVTVSCRQDGVCLRAHEHLSVNKSDNLSTDPLKVVSV